MGFKLYQQLDKMDCGPTCLKMISKHYGQDLSIEYLRNKSFITKDGVSLLGISTAAELIGYQTHGVKVNYFQLRNEVQLPTIIHWGENHFVVLYKIIKKKTGKDKLLIADPSEGKLELDADEFNSKWKNDSNKHSSGVALLLEPTPQFYKTNHRKEAKLNFSFLLDHLKPYRKFITQLLIGLFVGSLISLIFPYLSQSIIDVGVANNDLNFVVLILIAQVILTFGQTANGLIRSWITLHVTTRISISLISTFLAKLMRLPISFFNSKIIGDIIQRINDHDRIQEFLTKSVIDILFSVITLIMYSFVMASYNFNILIIFYVGSLTYASWVFLFLRKRKTIDNRFFKQYAKNQNSIIQLISGMQDIKLNNAEKRKRWEWESIQAKLFKVNISSLSLNQNQSLGSTFIDQIKNIIISFIAVKAVIDGNMTLGMFVAIQYIIGQLNSPISQFIGFSQSIQDAKISMERMNEIHSAKDEESENSEKLITPDNISIEVNIPTFKYEGPNSRNVLNNIQHKFDANKVTAIVGASGSGKTTLIKLMLGLIQPVEGQISINKINLNNYSVHDWRSKCGTVLQDGYIFSDTIINNIAISSENPNFSKVKEAAQLANADEFIQELPLKYNTKIGTDGTGLSTGQKQRLLIARAIYKKPSVLFLDEATNALDANNEKEIMSSLNDFFDGRTVVVVAHRLSTVKNANNIIVLQNGSIVESGNHKDLVENKSYYFNLIKNQLELAS